MTITLLLSGAALLAALAALVKARRIAKRLERLTESYWELRYEHGQLRARFSQLNPEQPGPAEPAQAAPNTFIPLSSLKR